MASKIVDPDQLNQGVEVIINSGSKTIQLLIAGNLNDNAPGQTSGVTKQCVYSFLKEEWKDDADLNKFKFPLKAIYEAKFDWQNGWGPADDQTRDLIRDAGWKEIDGTQYACIISLGSMDDDQVDLAYYQQEAGFDKTSTDFDKTGELDEAIMISSGSFDYTDYLKTFLREEQKTYAQYKLLTEQDLSALTYIAYRMPLANDDDIKATHSDAFIEASGPHMAMTIDYLVANSGSFETWSAGTYYQNDVLYNNNRWWRCTAVSSSDEPSGSADYESYPGERQLGANWYAFNRIVNGAAQLVEAAYELCQYKLRRTTDINDDVNGDSYGVVLGSLGVPLCEFVGDTLHTDPGTFVDNFDVNDKNRIVFHDITVDGGGLDDEDVPVTSTERTYPFVSAGTMVFSQNLVGETNVNTLYRMYFKNANGNEFDTVNAIVVNDNDGSPIEGQVVSGSMTFDFDYDNNNQGGRTPDTNADVVIVAQGLSDSEWTFAEFTITEATGLNFPVNAPDERNYSNP